MVLPPAWQTSRIVSENLGCMVSDKLDVRRLRVYCRPLSSQVEGLTVDTCGKNIVGTMSYARGHYGKILQTNEIITTTMTDAPYHRMLHPLPGTFQQSRMECEFSLSVRTRI